MILVALGANLSMADGTPPAATLLRAARAVAGLPGVAGPRLSRLWRSPPVPPSDQPDYVNAVLRLQGEAEAVALLEALHAVETRFGRVRGERNAARTLDLDLIDLGGVVREGPPPVLPHPRLRQRAFVLAPLAEVAPGWRHPVTGETVEALLAALPEAERAATVPFATAATLA